MAAYDDYRAAVLADSPHVYYPLLNSIQDATAAARHATNMGGVVLGQPSLFPDGSGASAQFTGVAGSYLNLPTSASPTGAQVTVEFWARKSGGSTQNNLMEASTSNAGGGTGRILTVHHVWSDNNIYWDAGTPYQRLLKATDFDVTQAHHYAFVKNATTGAMRIYIDGMEWATASGQTNSLAAAAYVTLGASVDTGYLWSGHMSHFAMYATALTQAQVARHYQAGKATSPRSTNPHRRLNDYVHTVLSDEPIGYWRMNEIANPVGDHTGSGMTGTLAGIATDRVGRQGPIAYDASSRGMDFTGASGWYIDIANAQRLNVTALTVEAWVQPASGNFIQNGFIFEKGQVNTQYALFLENPTGIVWRTVHAGALNNVVYAPPQSVASGQQWNHIVGTFSQGWKTLFLNGVQVASGSAPAAIDFAEDIAAIATQGQKTGNYWMNGTIAEIAIYDKALDADRIAAHYNIATMGKAPSAYERAVLTDSPTMYYPMHERGRDFDPRSLGGLIGWMDPSVITGFGSGATMTANIPNKGSWSTPWTPQAGGPIYRSAGAGGPGGVPYLEQYANIGSGIQWAQDLRFRAHTIIYRAQMRDAAVGRILSSVSNNWLLGWWSTYEDMAHFDTWVYGPDTADYGNHAYVTKTTVPRVYASTFQGDGRGNRHQVWRNGRLVASAVKGLGPNGLTTSGYQAASEFTNANVYEILVYDRVLTDDEIYAVTEYLMPNLADARRSGMEGQFNGGPASAKVAGPHADPGLTSWYFGGSGSPFVLLDSSASAAAKITGPATWECWLYPTDNTARRNPFDKAYAGEFSCTYEPAQTISFYWGDGPNYNALTGNNSAIPINTWSHMALVRGTSLATSYIYVNGVDQTLRRESTSGTGSQTFHTPAATGNSIFIGNGYAGSFLGRMSDFAIYRRALSVAEIQSHYRAAFRHPRGLSSTGGYGG